ncbi:hypothetical protein Tco_1167146 [Tanacetum coccineum]
MSGGRYEKIPICYDDDEDYTIAITPVLLTEEPVDSLIMEDEHLDTIPATESDEVIKSSVEELVLIPSESEGISDGVCDVPLCDNPTPFKAFKDHSEIVVNSNDDDTSSDDDDFEDIEYVEASPPDLEISPPFPIPDSNYFFEKSDTSLSYSDNYLPEFESFSDHTEEMISGSTTTHANNSLPEYDLFHFEIEPDQGELTNVVMEDILGEPRVHTPNVIPQDHEDPCLFSILQSSGLRSFAYFGILNPDHVQRIENKAKTRVTFDDVFTFIEVETKSLIFLDHTIGKSMKLRVQRWQVQGTVHPRWQYEVAGNVRWQYEVAAVDQSEHDTCPKRVIQGCQACVSSRFSCGDPRQ